MAQFLVAQSFLEIANRDGWCASELSPVRECAHLKIDLYQIHADDRQRSLSRLAGRALVMGLERYVTVLLRIGSRIRALDMSQMGMTADPLRIVRSAASSIEEIRADVAARFANGRFDIAPEARRGQTRMRTSLELGGVRIDQIHAVGGRISATAGEFRIGVRHVWGLRVTRGHADAVTQAGRGVVSLGAGAAKFGVPHSAALVGLRPEFCSGPLGKLRAWSLR